MPKAKKSSKKDTSSFIKKVASAGRGGDTELAYLSPKARDLLKKLGGAGTVNPKTKLKEYRTADVLARARARQAEEALAQFNALRQSTMEQMPQGSFGVPTLPGAIGPAEVDTISPTGESEPIRQQFAPTPQVTTPVNPPRSTAQATSAAEDLSAFGPVTAPAPVAEPSPPPPLTPPANSAAADLNNLTQVGAPTTATGTAPTMPTNKAPTTVAPAAPPPPPAAPAAGSAAADLAQLSQADLDAIAKALQNNPMPQNLQQAIDALKPGSLTTPTGQVNAQFFDPNFDLGTVPNVDPSTVSAQQQETMAAAKRMREREDLFTPAGGAGKLPGDRPGLTAPGSTYDPDASRRAAEEAAARAAEEAARRAAQEEAARRAAEEEAARRAAEQAAQEEARRQAEDAARRAAAEEEARRAAEEQARRIAEQDAQARRAAEEARRVAEEAARRQAEEEERRKAAQQPPPSQPPPTTQPPVSGPPVTVPPGLITSPLPTGPGTVPGSGDVRTHDFIDKNLNGIDDRDEEPPTGGGKPSPIGGGGSGIIIGTPVEPEPPRAPVRGPFDFSGVDPNSDIGRLIARLREKGGGRGSPGTRRPGGSTPVTPIPPTGGGKPAPMPPLTGGIPPSVGVPTPGLGGTPPGSGYIPTPGPIPGYQAAPLPTMPGAGTGTPFFNPNTGGLTPGTIPVGQMPQSLQTSNIPLQAIGANPNLSPTVLGGAQNLGYYTDRFGNVILSPGAVKPPGRKKGGPSNQEELMQLLQEQGEAEGYKDLDSARAMLEQLSNEAPQSQMEVRLSPNAQSIRRASRTPIRQETDRGTARGMAMELEEVTKSQGPRTKGQTEEFRQRMELLRDTLGMPTLTRAGLGRAGDLMAKRFNEGGEVDDSTPLQRRIYMESVGDPAKATAPITEKSMSARELDKLRRLVEIAEKNPALSEKTGKPLPGVVDYAHQRMLMEQVDPMGSAPLFMRDSDFNALESGNLRNTLGQFTFERLPDGSLVVRDTYDYTGDVGERFNPLIKYANKKGVNRPVEIRLPAAPKKGKR